MEHQYTLLKQTSRSAFFARICIEVLESESDAVINGLPDKAEPGDYDTVTKSSPSAWVEPAMEGLTRVLNHFSGTDRMRYHITLKEIVGSNVDSNSFTMRCAAECCLWEVLKPGKPLPEIEWGNGQCSLKY